MSEQSYRSEITNSDLNVTPAARDKLIELLGDVEDDEVKGVRIFVSGGGCGGMTYGMTFTTMTSDFDRLWNENDLNVYVDSVALNYLNGAEIDFVEQGMGSSFVFNNVFASVGGSGGCSACGATGGGGGGCA